MGIVNYIQDANFIQIKNDKDVNVTLDKCYDKDKQVDYYIDMAQPTKRYTLDAVIKYVKYLFSIDKINKCAFYPSMATLSIWDEAV